MSANERCTRFHFKRIARSTSIAILMPLAVCAAGCSSSSIPALPPEDDAFLSYWQCAEGLANGLKDVQTRNQFIERQPAIPGRGEATSLKEIFDNACAELEEYGERLQELPDEEIDRLREKHKELVQRVTDIRDELARRHEQSPAILGADWQRYQLALRLELAASE